MSLIHEALARAREEAARRAALERGEAPPPGPQPDHYRFRSPLWIVSGLGIFLLLGGIALGLWLASSGREVTRTAAVSSREGTTEPAANSVAAPAPAAPRSGAETDAGPPPAEPPAPAIDGAGSTRAPVTPPSDGPALRSPAPERSGSASAPSRDADSSLPENSIEGLASTKGAVPAPPTARPGRRTAPKPESGARVDLGGGRWLELHGVVWNTVSPSAVINGTLMEPGESVEGFELVRIEPRTAVLSDGEREVVLVLGPGGG